MLAIAPSSTVRLFFAMTVAIMLSATYLIAQEKGNGKENSSGSEIKELQQSFQNPPDDARIMMRWWWFGPAVTKEEVARELHAMKEAGIGGVEIQCIYPLALDDAAAGIRNLPFLSDEHLDALKYANEHARALGLRVDLTMGSGWPFGGPSVTTAEAAGQLRVARSKLGDRTKPVSVPRLADGEKLLAVFLAATTIADAKGKGKEDKFAPEGTRELTEIKNGIVALPADIPEGAEVIFFISSRTGQKVKRASVGSEGFVLNHYDRAAVDTYLHNVGDRLMKAFGDNPPYAVFSDSLEAFLSD